MTHDTPGARRPGDTAPMKYIVAKHADGYQVIKQGATRGISTHANILDALATCRAANRFARSL